MCMSVNVVTAMLIYNAVSLRAKHFSIIIMTVAIIASSIYQHGLVLITT